MLSGENNPPGMLASPEPRTCKMSKRDKGASLTSYMDEGFLPEAVVNYLCLLGWSPKDDREKMEREVMAELRKTGFEGF